MSREPETLFIGLSATPWRKGMAEEGWDDLLQPVSLAELTRLGRLVPARVFAASHPDLSGVRTVRGDYHEGQIAEIMADGALAADVVETWLAKGENRATLCFCVNRAHAKTMQGRFEAAGVPAGYIDAFTKRLERDLILEKLREGRLKVICNVGVLTTGFDAPLVSCISFCRPTKSIMLYLQIVGRGLRVSPVTGKTDCLVFDHTDTCLRLGLPTDIRRGSLLSGKSEQSATDRAPPLPKACTSCGFVKPPKARACPACGFAPEAHCDPDTLDVELLELDAQSRPAKRGEKTWEDKQRWWSMLLGMARDRGKSHGWALAQYRDRFGAWPRGLVDEPRTPTREVSNWVTSKAIAWARRRQRAA